MRISDWSSDVCSSDLVDVHEEGIAQGFDQADQCGRFGRRAIGAERAVGTQCIRIPAMDALVTPGADAGRDQQVHPSGVIRRVAVGELRSEEHTSELQSLMRISYAVFCLKKKKTQTKTTTD